MKRFSFVACAMSALALVSCGEATGSSEEAKEKALDSVKVFAVNMATKVSKNQKDSVMMVYADAAKADSLALSFVTDSVKVAEIDSVTFSADFGGGKTISIKKDAQGKLTITESKGLFAYPENDLDFAKKTGMWTDSLTDAQFAERFATKEEFRKYLISTFDSYSPLVVKRGGTDSYEAVPGTNLIVSTQKFIVTNRSDKPISGSEYNVRLTWFDNMSGDCQETKKGRDLAPNASTTYEVEYSGIGGMGAENCKVIYTTSKEQQFEKNFQPKGDEYQKFLNSKKK